MHISSPNFKRAFLETYPELINHMEGVFFYSKNLHECDDHLRAESEWALHNCKQIVYSVGECSQPSLLEKVARITDVIIEDLDRKNIPRHPYPAILFVGTMTEKVKKYYNTWVKAKGIKYPPILLYGCQHDEVYHEDTTDIDLPLGKREKKFLSLNRTPRLHRIWLVSELTRLGLIDDGLVSLNFNPEVPAYRHRNVSLPFNPHKYSHNWPLLLDVDDLDKYNPMIGHFETESLHTRAYFSIVTETIFFNAQRNDPPYDWERNHWVNSLAFPDTFKDEIFFSEKIYKPLYYKQPFVALSVPKSLEILKDLGYMTFDKWIDESYDNIENFNLRFKALISEIKRLVALSDDQWVEMIHEMVPILEHNHKLMVDKPYSRAITKNAIDYFGE